MDFIISQQLLITVYQTIQNATHPNLPYSTVAQVLDALTKLPPAPPPVSGNGNETEEGNNEPESEKGRGKGKHIVSNANGRRVTG